MDRVRVRVDDGLYLLVEEDADLAEVLGEVDLGAPGLDLEAHAGVLFVSTIDEEQEFVDLEIRRLAEAPDGLLDELAKSWGPWHLGQIHGDTPLDIQTIEREPVCQVTRSPGSYDVALFGRVDEHGAENHLMLVWPDAFDDRASEPAFSDDRRPRDATQTIGSRAKPVTTIDDDQVRVTTWTFAGPGASTGQHVHEHDYVVVPVTGGTFRVTMADGSLRELSQEAGVPYRGAAGTAHEVVNGGDGPAVFVEVELKW